ncbi:MAG TPA: LicD family protein [Firmicutes bacterium]|nr:LicD family protein [Bacillota bacterium]
MKIEGNGPLSPQELRAIQEKSLEILVYFKEFCQKHGLLFYFCGGCCIGAIRHKGFIPWDDDIDVFMPRKDYERLAQLWPKEADPQYAYCRSDKGHYLRSLLSAISDENTTFIKERQQDLDISHGIRLEILPLDGCPESRFARKRQILWALIYSMFNNNEAPTSKGKGAYLLGRFLLALAPTQGMRYRVWRLAEKRMSRWPITPETKHITELCARYQYMVNDYPAEAFASAKWVEFEGLSMPVPIGYDTYLRMAFGDYMQLPPEEERIPKHEAVLVDTEHSYRQYKGTYYCRK